MDLKKYIRSVPNYPKKGILFRDITTLIKNKDAFRECIDQMSKILSKLNYKTKTNLKNGILKTYDYIKKRGPKSFDYHINLEIKNELTPEVWLKKEL